MNVPVDLHLRLRHLAGKRATGRNAAPFMSDGRQSGSWRVVSEYVTREQWTKVSGTATSDAQAKDGAPRRSDGQMSSAVSSQEQKSASGGGRSSYASA